MTEKSRIMQSIEDMQAYDNGDDSRMTFHSVSVSEPPAYNAEEIKQIRKNLHVTQLSATKNKNH
ncbi:hypothetical protein ACFQ3L_11360 [Lacticaseibacillus jixianensis]|uniref:Uncharacterized protein n=1 Tax=Lacticaseibacillus jixianensis TaxID=2486012 RepID=A0ABW4BBN5_9LACO|nr:hypothetical protein [Lacticaseibacillus jixianensis]